MRRPRRPRAPAPTPSPPPGAPLDTAPPKTGAYEPLLARQRAEEARLRAEIARTRRSPTVEASLRVARLTGRISPALETSLRRDWANANATLGKLTGVRRSELAYVVGTVRSLAASHTLTADRLRPTFLVLRTNARFWAREPMPASGFRTSPNADPAIFQYYPGRGMQLQPLASWGRANAIAGACLEALRTPDQEGHLPPGRAGQEPGPPDRARRAPLRLPGVGVLLRLRHRLAAVGERDDAGDRRAGARARLPRARQGALAAQRAAGAGRLRAGPAVRRLGARARRPPLRPVLVRADRTASSTAACRP